MLRTVTILIILLTFSGLTAAAVEFTNDFVFVEGGTFMMGDVEGDQWEMASPPHEVSLTYSYYIDAYMITYSEWDAYCTATGASAPYDSIDGIENEPVSNISWYDATAYCNWVSESLGLSAAYNVETGDLLDAFGNVTTNVMDVRGIRLPTEAEWEWSAGGGIYGTDTEFAGSDNADEVAWHFHNSGAKTQPVGLLAPNELGLYDMSGNLFEWCNDWFRKYRPQAIN